MDRADPSNASRASLLARCDRLEREVRRLRQHKQALEEEVGRLRARPPPRPGAIHGRVHLTPDAPRWLISDVRKSFRLRYHPDKQEDAEEKLRVQRIFQEAEQVFSKLLS